MIIVDSCGWIEYFIDGKRSSQYYEYLKKPNKLVIPSITIYEVYKKIKIEAGEEKALLAVGQMHNGFIVNLKTQIAILAGDLSIEYKLPMADAIVYATAKSENALLVTHDKHFKGLSDVKFIV